MHAHEPHAVRHPLRCWSTYQHPTPAGLSGFLQWAVAGIHPAAFFLGSRFKVPGLQLLPCLLESCPRPSCPSWRSSRQLLRGPLRRRRSCCCCCCSSSILAMDPGQVHASGPVMNSQKVQKARARPATPQARHIGALVGLSLQRFSVPAWAACGKSPRAHFS